MRLPITIPNPANAQFISRESNDPLNRQSQHAPALLELVDSILQDRQYVARLERHYRLVKDEAAKKSRQGKR